MSLFENLSSEGLEETQDRIGGFQTKETDAYDATIKAFYAGESSGGAKSVTIIADIGGSEYRETVYVTSKKGENFYLNKDDKTKKIGLPGFIIASDICLVTVEKELKELTFEDKTMNIYDPEVRREVPKSVKMAVELIGKKVNLGIVKQLENKNDKVGNDYVPNADTREVNFIDKVFHNPSNLTVVEARNNITEAKFRDAWVARNQGQTRDKRTIKDGENSGNAGRPGQAPAAGATPAKGKSLFGG